MPRHAFALLCAKLERLITVWLEVRSLPGPPLDQGLSKNNQNGIFAKAIIRLHAESLTFGPWRTEGSGV